MSRILTAVFFSLLTTAYAGARDDALQEVVHAGAVGRAAGKNSGSLEESVMLNRSWASGEKLDRPSLSLVLEQESSGVVKSLQTGGVVDEAGEPMFTEADAPPEAAITADVEPENLPKKRKRWFERLLEAGLAAKDAVVKAGRTAKDAVVKAGRTAKDAVVGELIEAGFMGAHNVADIVSRLQGNPPVPLTDGQKSFLKQIYGDSLDTDKVVIQRGSFMDRVINAPHVSGNVVYLPEDWGGPLFDQNGSLTKAGLDILTHEIGHVWQYQNGGGDYISKAWGAQKESEAATGDRNSAYDWRKYSSQGVSFDKLNPEAQAELMKDVGKAYLNGGQTPVERALLAVDLSGFDKRKPDEINEVIDRIIGNERNLSDESINELVYILRGLAAIRNGRGAP